jgi:uncharacterized repeat protein (TIGR01451 family)
VQVGDSLNYLITVSNSAGPSTALATVTDVLPSELSSGEWSCISFGAASCAGGVGNTLTDTATLPAGTHVTYVYSATVQPGSPDGVIMNSVNAIVANNGDPNSLNNTASDTPWDQIVISRTDLKARR